MGLLVLKEAQGKTKHWDQVLSLDSTVAAFPDGLLVSFPIKQNLTRF